MGQNLENYYDREGNDDESSKYRRLKGWWLPAVLDIYSGESDE